MKYIVKDRSGNVMEWKGNPYSTREDAFASINKHCLNDLSNANKSFLSQAEMHELFNCISEYHIDKDVLTKEDIRKMYYNELPYKQDFDDYLKENFVEAYDDKLNFIGYERELNYHHKG